MNYNYPISDEELDSLEMNIRQAGGKWSDECLELILEIRLMKAHKQADDMCYERVRAIAFKNLGLPERKREQLEELIK